jgi:hypothetical protein
MISSMLKPREFARERCKREGLCDEAREEKDVLCEEMVMRLSLHTSPFHYCLSFLFFIFNPT